MENDEKLYIEDNIYTRDNELEKEVFRFDYEHQKIKNNNEFQKWKYELEKKYGQSIRLYKCNKDKIYFYHKINDKFDEYVEFCPECKEYICCFCSQILYRDYLFSSFIGNYCCLKRLFLFIFYREKISEENITIIEYIILYVGFLIPIINGFFLILCIIQNLFCLKKCKYTKLQKYNLPDIYSIKQYYEYHNLFLFSIFEIITALFVICMTIPFVIFIIIYSLILFLISIPFKMIPLNNFIIYFAENSTHDL